MYCEGPEKDGDCHSDFCSTVCWHDFFLESGPKLYRYLYHILGNERDAEDCLQETFARFFEKIRYYDPTRRLFPFLIRIARNIAYNHIRKNSRLVYTGDDDNDFSDDVDSESDILEDLTLEQAIEWIKQKAALTEAQATLLVYSAVDQLKPAEIACMIPDVENAQIISKRMWRLRKKITRTISRDDIDRFFGDQHDD